MLVNITLYNLQRIQVNTVYLQLHRWVIASKLSFKLPFYCVTDTQMFTFILDVTTSSSSKPLGI